MSGYNNTTFYYLYLKSNEIEAASGQRFELFFSGQCFKNAMLAVVISTSVSQNCYAKYFYIWQIKTEWLEFCKRQKDVRTM